MNSKVVYAHYRDKVQTKLTFPPDGSTGIMPPSEQTKAEDLNNNYNYNKEMPQLILYLDEKENQMVEKKSEQWKLSKAESIKRIIRES